MRKINKKTPYKKYKMNVVEHKDKLEYTYKIKKEYHISMGVNKF